jgi:hypothetical protein
MRNSQRHRLKAAECLAAAKLCQGDYRGLLVSIAVFWQWLARQDEAVEKVLVSWEVGEPDRQTGQVLAFRPISPARQIAPFGIYAHRVVAPNDNGSARN